MRINICNIPVFDIGAVVAGAYAGYCSAKGIDIGHNAEIAKYGPAILAATTTSAAMLLGKSDVKKTKNQNRGILRTDLEKTEEKAFSYPHIAEASFTLGAKTAAETIIGYGLGHLAGKLT